MSDYFSGLGLGEFIEQFWGVGRVFFPFYSPDFVVIIFCLGFGFSFLVQSTILGSCCKPYLSSQSHHTDFSRDNKTPVKSYGKAFSCIFPLFFCHLWPFKMTRNRLAEGCWHIQHLLWLDKPALCIVASCFVGFFKGAIWCWSDLLNGRSGPGGDGLASREWMRQSKAQTAIYHMVCVIYHTNISDTYMVRVYPTSLVALCLSTYLRC